MSKYRRQVFIQNAPQQGLGFLPQRRYRDDFEIDEEPLYMPSTAKQNSADDDEDDTVQRPFANQYDDYDDDDLDLDLPSTASKKVRMREIIANGCDGCSDEDDVLYLPYEED